CCVIVSARQLAAHRAVQLAHLRRFLRPCHGRLLVAPFVERAQKSPPGRKLCLLRRLEPAVRVAALRHHRARFLARRAHRRRTSAAPPSTRKAWLVASIAANLSMLGFFKYGNFLLENTQWLLAQAGVAYQPPHLDLFLPIGISFYTFHSLSYTLDVYRGATPP